MQLREMLALKHCLALELYCIALLAFSKYASMTKKPMTTANA